MEAIASAAKARVSAAASMAAAGPLSPVTTPATGGWMTRSSSTENTPQHSEAIRQMYPFRFHFSLL